MSEQNIYEKLWNIDQSENGLSCSVVPQNGEAEDADIFINEQHEISFGNAPEPLFVKVNEDKMNNDITKAFKSLMNNYIFKVGRAEDELGTNEEEDKERESFLNLIMETKVFEEAFEYVKNHNDIPIHSKAEFKSEIERMWFKPYDNSLTGFEHILVGESHRSNGIGGYHSWTKFYWDEKVGRVDFLGFNYVSRANPNKPLEKLGPTVPHVATISFEYVEHNFNGDLIHGKKPMGGFFVGMSPELQIIFPTVAFLEKQHASFDPKVTIDGAKFVLKLFTRSTSDGVFLRTFYPAFTGIEQRPVPVPVQTRILIHSVLANPHDEDTEWVKIKNSSSDSVDVNGWTLQDHARRKTTVTGSVESGKSLQVFVRKTGDIQLTNSGGSVTLFDSQGNVVDKVHYGSSRNGHVFTFQ